MSSPQQRWGTRRNASVLCSQPRQQPQPHTKTTTQPVREHPQQNNTNPTNPNTTKTQHTPRQHQSGPCCVWVWWWVGGDLWWFMGWEARSAFHSQGGTNLFKPVGGWGLSKGGMCHYPPCSSISDCLFRYAVTTAGCCWWVGVGGVWFC